MIPVTSYRVIKLPDNKAFYVVGSKVKYGSTEAVSTGEKENGDTLQTSSANEDLYVKSVGESKLYEVAYSADDAATQKELDAAVSSIEASLEELDERITALEPPPEEE